MASFFSPFPHTSICGVILTKPHSIAAAIPNPDYAPGYPKPDFMWNL
jgi:hypothetical protein